MIDLRDREAVKAVQHNMRSCFDNPGGQEVIKLLEQVCGWYDFQETDPNRVLVAHGKRQVLATIKTMMKCSTDEIVALAKQQQGE